MKIVAPSGYREIEVKDNESLNIYLEDFEEKSADFILEVFLKGKNAKVSIEGRAHCTENFSKKWNVKIFFQGENQVGVLNLRGIAEDESLLEFDGGAIVKSCSAQANVEVSEKVVLFDQAKGRCIPVLRVETDDVSKASHAASIAPFEEEQILFATSRGMADEEAVRLFKEGFLEGGACVDKENLCHFD